MLVSRWGGSAGWTKIVGADHRESEDGER